MKRKPKKPAGGVAPRSTLAIAGKERPPKKEKLRGGELPPPEAARKSARRGAH